MYFINTGVFYIKSEHIYTKSGHIYTKSGHIYIKSGHIYKMIQGILFLVPEFFFILLFPVLLDCVKIVSKGMSGGVR